MLAYTTISGGGHHGGHHGHHGGGGGGHHGGRGGGYYTYDYAGYPAPNELFIEPTAYYMTGVVAGKQVTWVAPIADYTGAYYQGTPKPTSIAVLTAK